MLAICAPHQKDLLMEWFLLKGLRGEAMLERERERERESASSSHLISPSHFLSWQSSCKQLPPQPTPTSGARNIVSCLMTYLLPKKKKTLLKSF